MRPRRAPVAVAAVTRAIRRLARLALAAVTLAAAGCGGRQERPDEPVRAPAVLVARAPMAAAMVALPGGGLRFGELKTGIVRDADARGRVDPTPVVRVAVSTAGQRGLLGLALDRRGATFAAWTEPGGRILVGRVAPGAERIVWRGPPSATLANGGHLSFTPGGRLLIGIGDLQQPRRVRLAGTPNGKLLSLRPEGPPSQRPRELSRGWNNPFGFTFTPAGALWVADNAAGMRPERLAPGARDPQVATFLELPPNTAPSGVAAISSTQLAVCGVRSRRLERYRLRSDAPPHGPEGAPLATDCALGVVRLADGRLAYTTFGQIKVARP